MAECRECGHFHDKAKAAFCCTPCRQAWNNRRMQRGAQLYDLFMAVRYQRGLAKVHSLWSIVCRLAQSWREEDVRERGGRPSWRAYTELHDGLLPHRVEELGRMRAGR